MHHIGIFRLFIIGFAIYYIAIGEFCKNQMSRNFKHFNLKKIHQIDILFSKLMYIICPYT